MQYTIYIVIVILVTLYFQQNYINASIYIVICQTWILFVRDVVLNADTSMFLNVIYKEKTHAHPYYQISMYLSCCNRSYIKK